MIDLKDMVPVHRRWVAAAILNKELMDSVIVYQREWLMRISARNQKLCKSKSVVFFFKGIKYPSFAKATYGIEVPSLHAELHEEMSRWLIEVDEEIAVNKHSFSFVHSVLFAEDCTYENLFRRLPQQLKPTLKGAWGLQEVPYSAFSADEVGEELSIPEEVVEGFKMRLVRMLLE